MPTRCRARLVVFSLLAVSLVRTPATTTLMPLSEVRPGMVGVGRTVFDGDAIAEFEVHVLGVLRNVIGPRRHLILARLEGGPLADTGVLQGMSGSPVFIDGRLVGAVSYSLGAFPKEPIAGITPIGEMTEVLDQPDRRAPSTRVRLELPLTPERFTSTLRDAFLRLRPFADSAADLEVLGLPRVAGAEIGLQLRPIATPLAIGGFSGAIADLLRQAFAASGFVPLSSGGTVQQAEGGTRPLAPGDAVGVTLLSGDFEMSASGTVTHVEDDRVFAFGHPFFNLGPIQFPMTRAAVYTLLPSVMTSQKIAALGEVVGTFAQDRATAIAGRLGAGPRLIPMQIGLRSDRGPERVFQFEVVNDEFFTPLLTYLTVPNTLVSYERQLGTATFSVTGRAEVAGHDAIVFSDLFTGANATTGAASYVAGPVTFLMGNQFEPIRLERVDLTIAASEEPRTATIERVWVEEPRLRAGQTVPVKVLVREYGGTEHVMSVSVVIPASAPPSVSVLVADGSQLMQWEQHESQRPPAPRTVNQMIRTLNTSRRHSHLYVRLYGPEAGAVVNGEVMPALPPSVLRVLESSRGGSAFAPIRQAVLGSWDVPTDYAVSGSRVLTLTLEPGRQ